MTSGLRARLRRAREADPATFRVRVVLAALVLLLVARLVFGEDPWTGGLAARARKGGPIHPMDYVNTWSWWTAAAITPVLVLLFVTAPRWLCWGPVRECREWAPAPTGRLFAVLLAGAMLAGALLSAPRLSMSLFEDERITVWAVIDGRYQVDHDGKLRFLKKHWSDAVWWYHEPNNHVVQSILSRASVSVWRAFASPESRQPSEVALRLPAWLAGIGAIGAVGLLLRRMGYPPAGLTAAWLLALHPWHLRYASEARGYSLLALLCPFALWALWAALERGTWRRWSVYGAGQFLMIWTYPPIVYFLVVLAPVAAWLVWRQHRGTPFARQQLWRWAIVNLAGALLFIHLMTGNLFQLREYLAQENDEHMDALWFRDLGGYLLLGINWGRQRANADFWELSDAYHHARWLWASFGVAVVAATAAGLVRLVRAGFARALTAAVCVLPPLLAIGVTLATGGFLFPQYVLFALPGLVVLAALGITWPGARLGARGGALVAVGALAAYAAASEPARYQYQTRPLQPFRESVLLTRPSLDPRAPENAHILTVSFSWPPDHYDPLVHKISRPEELEFWMRESDRTGYPLFVNIGQPRLAERKFRKLMAIVENDELFEEIAYLPSVLYRGSRGVWRYRGRREPSGS